MQEESGQALVIMAVWLTVLLGMAAVAVDLGAWYHSQRALQARVDAAALAGAQELPFDTANATAVAAAYGNKNGGAVPDEKITIQQTTVPNDSVKVTANNTAPTFFAKTFGLDSVNVRATATAVSNPLGEAQYVAPIVVNKAHPMISGVGCPSVPVPPCFKQPTTLPLGKTGAPGAFALVDLANQIGGGDGSSALAAWINDGFQGKLDVGDYFSNTGAKWDSWRIQDALGFRLGTVLLFPVYDTLVGTGTTAQYHVVGWIGFRLTGYTARGSDGDISGYFTRVVWEGLPPPTPTSVPDLGARTVSLIG